MEIRQGGRVFHQPKMVSDKDEPTPATQDDMQKAAAELLKTAKDNINLMSAGRFAREMMSPPREEGSKGEASTIIANAEAANQQMGAILKSVTDVFTGLIALEREAKINAENTSSTAMEKYYNLLAEQAQALQQRIEGASMQGPQTLEDQLKSLQLWNGVINENAKGLAMEAVKSMQPAVSHSGMTSVDVDLKRLESDQLLSLERMKQQHELAMKQMDVELAKMNIQIAQWQAGQANRQNMFGDIVSAFGKAVQQGVVDGSAPAQGVPDQARSGTQFPHPTRPAAAKSQAGLIQVQCSNPECLTAFAIVPGMESVACPSCGSQYKVTDLITGEE